MADEHVNQTLYRSPFFDFLTDRLASLESTCLKETPSSGTGMFAEREIDAKQIIALFPVPEKKYGVATKEDFLYRTDSTTNKTNNHPRIFPKQHFSFCAAFVNDTMTEETFKFLLQMDFNRFLRDYEIDKSKRANTIVAAHEFSPKTTFLISLKTIQPGEEILFGYGPLYWIQLAAAGWLPRGNSSDLRYTASAFILNLRDCSGGPPAWMQTAISSCMLWKNSIVSIKCDAKELVDENNLLIKSTTTNVHSLIGVFEFYHAILQSKRIKAEDAKQLAQNEVPEAWRHWYDRVYEQTKYLADGDHKSNHRLACETLFKALASETMLRKCVK
jgi:hypothetical protein